MRSSMFKPPGRRLSHDRGAALVEAALVMPMMLMLTVAVRAVVDQELSASAIVPADVTTVCIAQGNAPCGGAAIPGVDQVAVELSLNNYQMDFIFFSISVDLTASAVSRWEG